MLLTKMSNGVVYYKGNSQGILEQPSQVGVLQIYCLAVFITARLEKDSLTDWQLLQQLDV